MRLSKINATVFLTIALPLFAVIASVSTAVVAVSSGDPPLPADYHWEGDKLDHDFSASRRASDLGVEAVLDLRPREGACRLSLSLRGSEPSVLNVDLIHVSSPALDRHMRFIRMSDGAYSAPCAALPATRWHIELSDGAGSWRFRAEAEGELGNLVLSSTLGSAVR